MDPILEALERARDTARDLVERLSQYPRDIIEQAEDLAKQIQDIIDQYPRMPNA